MTALSRAESPLDHQVQAGAGCGYVRQDRTRCPHPAREGGSGLCFWHDPAVNKRGTRLVEELETLVQGGESLEGFQLRGADLSHAYLTQRERAHSVNLSHADLARANLQDAHLFHIDLRHSSLFKADLRRANLNNARLDSADLLAADLRETKLEAVDWGLHLRQEYRARELMRLGKRFEARQAYSEAEETCRVLSLAMAERGHPNQAGRFFQRQMIMRRMQLPLWSAHRLWSKIADLLCGYGESPARVVGFTLAVVFASALVQFFLGITGPQGPVIFDLSQPIDANVLALLECLYFSVVTFTTVGYGDFLPVGWGRALSAIESLIGAFSISLFVVVFVKRMTR
jgi:hypothetical protein